MADKKISALSAAAAAGGTDIFPVVQTVGVGPLKQTMSALKTYFLGSSTAALAIAAGKTVTISNSITLTGTDGDAFAFPSGSDTVVTLSAVQTLSNKTLVAPALGTPASGVATNLTGTASGLTAGNVTTNANLTGPITSSGNATSIASQTGTGTKFVVDTSPTLVTPILGVATATSVNKLTITAPASSAVLTIADGKTLTASNSLTFAGTDATVLTFPTTSASIARIDAGQTFAGTNIFTSGAKINLNSVSAPTPITGFTLQVVGADAATATIHQDTFGAAPIFSGRRADGTGASPTGVLAGETLASFSARPYDGVTYASAPTGAIQAQASENFTATKHGTDIVGTCTAITTTTTAEAFRAKSNGFTIPTGSTYQINGVALAAANLSDGTTGTGAIVLATSPTLVTPTLGVASATTINKVTLTAPASGSTLTILNGKTLTVNNSLTLAGTDGTTMTFPGTSDTVACLATAQTFTATQTNSTAGAASTPAMRFSGAPYSAGTGTTNFPLLLIQPTAATPSSAWSSFGTAFGVNLANTTGFCIDVRANGTAVFNVKGDGTATFGGSITTGGLTTGGVSASASITFSTATSALVWTGRGIFTSPAAGSIQFGSADAASPVAQSIRAQSVVAGTSNTAGQNTTIRGSLSTGSGASGDIVFQTGGTGAASTTQNTAVTALTIKGATQAVVVASGAALQLGNAATTGLTAGVLAATTNASIVITDSTGQAYRIPCII